METYHCLTNGGCGTGKTTATITISGSSDVFTAIGEVIKFDGFLRVYRESYDDENEQEDESRLLPPLKKGQKLEHGPITATERFTQRPPRYTEASLVRKLEELVSDVRPRMHLLSLPFSNANMWKKEIKTVKNGSLMS